MRLWSRIVAVGLVLSLALGLAVSPANAAPKKKKKEESRSTYRESGMHPISGLNLEGKPGYIISDTAGVLNKGQVAGAGHLTFDTWGNVLQIPVGVSFGITDKITVNANTSFYAAGGLSGLNYLGFGGKYAFKSIGHNKDLDIAAGLDFAIGPLYTNFFGTDFAFDPYGVVTYTFVDGLQLNGKLGLYVQTYNYKVGPLSLSGSWSYFQLDLGVAYPFDHQLTGFGELATNGVVAAGGIGGTPLLVGIRTGKDIRLQAFAGLDLGGAVGLFVGGGVNLLSE